jgi:hypothetical protein
MLFTSFTTSTQTPIWFWTCLKIHHILIWHLPTLAWVKLFLLYVTCHVFLKLNKKIDKIQIIFVVYWNFLWKIDKRGCKKCFFIWNNEKYWNSGTFLNFFYQKTIISVTFFLNFQYFCCKITFFVQKVLKILKNSLVFWIFLLKFTIKWPKIVEFSK